MQKIIKGDSVKIMLGKDNGKVAKVVNVSMKEHKVVVEGVNTSKRHVRRMGNVEGGIMDIVKPVDVSNVMLVCPKCNKPTRVGFVIKNSEKHRVCKKCKQEIN
jgi:large subunit ribosomal protein L24